MDASGIQDYLIELYPWARVYKTALKQENTLILPLARTQNRENLFKWAGTILPVRFFLVRQKGSTIKITSIKDAKQYRIGVIRDDVSHQYLSDQGFERLSFVSRTDLLLGMLDKKRVDLICVTRGSMDGSCGKDQSDCAAYVFEWEFKDLSLDLYAAFSQNTDEKIVQKVGEGICHLKNTPAFNQIIHRLNRISD